MRKPFRVLSCATVALCVGTALAASSTRNIRPGSMTGGGRVLARTEADAGEEEGKVKLSKLPQPKSALVEAPEYTFNAKAPARLNNKNRQWALFEIEYQTYDRWMDQLAFTYHILCSGKDEETGKAVFNYFTTTVRYADVPKGKHRSAVGIPPSQIERYGTPYALAVEIVGKTGEPLVSDQVGPLPKEWWKSDKVMNNPNVKVERRNGLIDRSKTPFALINPTDYEWVF